MKTRICSQLGGPPDCKEVFTADNFEKIAEMSKKHGIEMFQSGDQSHLEAMEKMKELMQKPEDMQKWLEEKRREFKHAPEDQ